VIFEWRREKETEVDTLIECTSSRGGDGERGSLVISERTHHEKEVVEKRRHISKQDSYTRSTGSRNGGGGGGGGGRKGKQVELEL